MSLSHLIDSLLQLLHLPSGLVTPIDMLVVAAIILAFILVVVLVMIYGLRKIMGFIQVRLGPRRVGPRGIFQTPADALKLLIKEDVIPTNADRWVFTLAPLVVFVPAYLVYVVIPFGDQFVAKDLNIGILYIAAVTSIAVVGIIMGGWASDNKYSLIGALRSAAQMVSYEVPLVLAIVGPVLLTGSLSMQSIVHSQGSNQFWHWFVFPQFLAFLAFLIASFAETNHTPFDLPEAESELVSGFNVEYSGMKFAFFFLAEFANVFTVSAICVTLFFGGWQAPLPFLPHGGIFSIGWFLAKTSVLVIFFMWVRATLPRVRVDQLMEFGWKFLIPLTLLNILVTGLWLALA